LLKIEHLVMCLSTMTFVYAQHVLLFLDWTPSDVLSNNGLCLYTAA